MSTKLKDGQISDIQKNEIKISTSQAAASTQTLPGALVGQKSAEALTNQQPTLDTSTIDSKKQSEIAEKEKKLAEEAQKNEEVRKRLAEKEKELNEKERKLDEKEKAVKEERLRLKIRAEELDKRDEDPLWAAINAEGLEKIGEKLDQVNATYREKAKGLYSKQLVAVTKIQAKINSYRLKPGKNGLTRDRELKLRSEIINEKSKARKEYIKLTIHGKEEQEYALLCEKRRELRMLADLYRKLKFFDKLKEAEKDLEKMEDDILISGEKANVISLHKKISQDWMIRGEVEEETEKKEDKKEEKKENTIEDKKEEQKEKKEKIEIDIEGMEEFYPVLKEIKDERKKTLTALYVFVKKEDRKAWLDQHKDFEAPKHDDITRIVTDLIDLWKRKWGGNVKKLAPEQKDRLEKENRIPEVDKETVDLAVLRQIVTGLNEAAYNLVEFDKKALPVFQKISLYSGQVAQPAAEADKLRGYKYEKQERGNDCWICALDSLVNFSLIQDKTKNGQEPPAEDTLLKQGTVKGYKPQFRKDPTITYEAKKGETKEQKAKRENDIQQSMYTLGEKEIKGYMEGTATSRPGNIFALSDLIHEKAGKKAIRCLTFDISKSKVDDVAGDGKRNAYNNVKAKFIDVVKTALTNGRPLAVLVGMHYRVITEADGNSMMLLNSNPNMAEGEVAYAEEMTYDALFENTQRAVELTYLEDIDPAALTQDFEGLQYDAQQQKFSLAKDVDPLEDPEEVAINNGVVIHKKREKMPAEIADYVHEKICVPSSMQDQPAAN